MTNISIFPEFERQLQNFGSIPDMLRNMDLMFEVEKMICGKEDIISIGIKSCLKKQLPATTILHEIKQMAQDNYNAIGNLLGIALTDNILAL